VTPVPNQPPLVLITRGGARLCHSTILPELPTDGWQLPIAQARGHTSAGTSTTALMAGGGKAALAEET
jgi:hypothetical protein